MSNINRAQLVRRVAHEVTTELPELRDGCVNFFTEKAEHVEVGDRDEMKKAYTYLKNWFIITKNRKA